MQLTNPLTQQPISDTEIESVASLARKQFLLEKKITDMQALVAEAEKELFKVQMEALPMAMERLGLMEMTLSNGYEVKIAPFYSGSIPPNEGEKADPIRREKCFLWLRQNNFGALIKTEVKVIAGKGDEKLVKKVSKLLERAKVPFIQADNVHHMTLKSFIREQSELGKAPPSELFNTFIGKKSTLKKTK